MKKSFKVFFTLNSIVLLALALALPLSRFLGDYVIAAASVISMFTALFGAHLWAWFSIRYSSHWFKSVEQLEEETLKQTESWKKAEKLCRIIGEHEAVKMWEEEKKKKEVQDVHE